MEGFIGIENEHIKQLGPEKAVHLFRDLLWAEANKLGVSPEIRISERISVADGGIDASANNTTSKSSELLKAGYSGYQIKTGVSFNLAESKLKKELFGDAVEIAKENLGESVRGCLDQNGHLTFVCFGLDPNEIENADGVTLIKGWLATCGYPNASVRIWGATTLKGFLQDFPSLRLLLNGRGGGIFEIFENWRSHGDMEPATLSLGEKQKGVIEEIRTQLVSNTEALHLRILGGSGVGKTRLVLETLSDERFRPLVIYSDKPQQLENQGFFSHIAMPDNHMEVILVLDECSFDDAARYWNRLQNLGKRIKLITIHNEEHPQRGDTRLILLPPLERVQIEEILRQYNIPSEHLHRWASFCEGSPRWAKILGENIRNNSTDLLADPDTIPLVHRYIAGADDTADQAVKDRILVIRFLSLFKKFGYKPPVSGEADAIFQLIREYEPAISRARFDASVQNLYSRRILQGEKTYYITPRPLQVKLWVEWWNNHSPAFDFEKFNKLPPLLVQGFNDMFRFAQESQAALQTVEQLLGPEGPFADGSLLRQERGGNFFLALTEGAPGKALERLEATLGSWTKEQLLDFSEGRRQVIWSLERIAVWGGLFNRAMRILLSLAEAENDNVYSNNATGIFKDFFSIVSATEEPPLQRLPIIEELLSSGDAIKENLALQAISTALENHFTRMIGTEYQGLRREPQLWQPTGDKRQEAYDYLKRMWELLIEALDSAHDANRQKAATDLSHQLEVRGRNPETSEMALETARAVFRDQKIDKNKLIEVVVHILHCGKNELPDGTKRLWSEFYKELVPDDLPSLINRHVALNLTEDLFETGSHSEEPRNRTIKELAGRAYNDPAALRKELPWLVTERAGNGYLFGYELGKLDKDRHLLNEILEARLAATGPTRASQYFMGGYLRALYEADPRAWEKLFDDLSKEKPFLSLLPELAWRGGITDNVMSKLIDLAEANLIEPTLFAHFKYGVEIRTLGEKTFCRLVRSLLAHKKKMVASIALDIFARYYADKETGHELPKDLALEVLMDPTFFEVSEGYRDTMDDFIWGQVAGKFLEKFSDDKDSVLKIGFLMLDSIGNDGSIMDHTERYVKGILSRISELHPDEMWLRALNNLEEKGYFIFKDWLSWGEFIGADQVNDSLIRKIKLETLWDWVDQNVDKRAWFIASLVPNVFTNRPGEVCLAREVLVRYGDREDVRRNLNANFFTEGWSGRASAHHKAALDSVAQFRKTETNPNVIKWLDEYMQNRQDAIEKNKTEEERDDFWG